MLREYYYGGRIEIKDKKLTLLVEASAYRENHELKKYLLQTDFDPRKNEQIDGTRSNVVKGRPSKFMMSYGENRVYMMAMHDGNRW